MIEIIRGRIFWHEAANNHPSLQLLVTRVPKILEYVYERREDCYYSELDGICSFFSYTKPGNGFGGSSFELNMKDGGKEVLRGPWSSSCSAMNSLGFGPCVPASIIDEPDGYERGYTFYGGAVTMEMLGRYRSRITVTPYRINTKGQPYEGFDAMFRFPDGSRYTMLQLGSKDDHVRDRQPSDQQNQILDGGGMQFVPIVQLPNGRYWVKPSTFSVPVVPPDDAKIVELPRLEPGYVWTGGV